MAAGGFACTSPRSLASASALFSAKRYGQAERAAVTAVAQDQESRAAWVLHCRALLALGRGTDVLIALVNAPGLPAATATELKAAALGVRSSGRAPDTAKC